MIGSMMNEWVQWCRSSDHPNKAQIVSYPDSAPSLHRWKKIPKIVCGGRVSCELRMPMSSSYGTAVILLCVYLTVVLFLISQHSKTSPIYLNHIIHSGVATIPSERNFKVYIYNWKSEVIDRWPLATTHFRLSLEPQFRDNFGTGPILDASQGLHHTHQYSLFTIFLSSLRVSKYVTADPEEADIFFVPYDLGMDSTTRRSDGALTATNCPMVPQVIELLRTSPYFMRNNGSDHVLIHSINQPMTFFANAHCRSLYERCMQCIKLSIDTYDADLFPFLRTLPHMSHRWFSVPFPANYHLSKEVTHAPWKQVSQNSNYFPSQYGAQRNYRICFLGSTEVTAKKQRALRQRLVQLCQQRADVCHLETLSSHSSNVPYHRNASSLHTIGTFNAQTHLSRIVDPYSRCRLCLSPGGDYPTRKGFLDALLAGCVPVTFQSSSAIRQWPRHFGGVEVARNVSLLVDRERFLGSMDTSRKAFDELVEMSEDMSWLHNRIQAIGLVGDRLQYSLPGQGANVKDAFEVIIDLLREEVLRT